MTRPRLHIAAALLAMALSAAATRAHHSFAMFDPSKPLSFEGTVKTLQWTAPHAILWIETGKVSTYDPGLWSLELPTSPGNLSKMGWSRTVVKPGDRVRVDINPIRDGRRSGQFKKLVLLDTGRVLTVSAIPGQPQPPK